MRPVFGRASSEHSSHLREEALISVTDFARCLDTMATHTVIVTGGTQALECQERP